MVSHAFRIGYCTEILLGRLTGRSAPDAFKPLGFSFPPRFPRFPDPCPSYGKQRCVLFPLRFKLFSNFSSELKEIAGVLFPLRFEWLSNASSSASSSVKFCPHCVPYSCLTADDSKSTFVYFKSIPRSSTRSVPSAFSKTKRYPQTSQILSNSSMVHRFPR